MKRLRIVALVLVALLVSIPLCLLVLRFAIQHSVAAQNEITSKGGVHEMLRVRIGGIDQWIEVRGEDRNNPVLLFLHGGPGSAMMPIAREFQRPWERYFTVAQWDQRGAGKTYASNDPRAVRPTMTIAQMTQDAVDVSRLLQARYHKRKIFVLGHSWGSVLLLRLAHEHPELYYAAIGTGQVLSMRENETAGFQEVMQAAIRVHNDKAVRELRAIEPYPGPILTIPKVIVVRGWQEQLLGNVDAQVENRMLWSAVTAPQYTLADAYDWLFKTEYYSIDALLPELSTLDLRTIGTTYRVPLIFLEGRNDPDTVPQLVEAFSRRVKAPSVRFVWFERSGHFPFAEEPDAFLSALMRYARPFSNPPPSAR